MRTSEGLPTIVVGETRWVDLLAIETFDGTLKRSIYFGEGVVPFILEIDRSNKFKLPDSVERVDLVAVTQRDLGIKKPSLWQDIYVRASEQGLTNCPIETPFLLAKELLVRERIGEEYRVVTHKMEKKQKPNFLRIETMYNGSRSVAEISGWNSGIKTLPMETRFVFAK